MTESDRAGAAKAAPGVATGVSPHGKAALPQRRPPPMRIVTKGWWRLEEGRADIEALVHEDRDQKVG